MYPLLIGGACVYIGCLLIGGIVNSDGLDFSSQIIAIGKEYADAGRMQHLVRILPVKMDRILRADEHLGFDVHIVVGEFAKERVEGDAEFGAHNAAFGDVSVGQEATCDG
jgi:hypothetical protein